MGKDTHNPDLIEAGLHTQIEDGDALPEDKKTIPITCAGQKYLPLDQLHDFQGNLKSLSPEQEKKLMAVILRYGFSFPVFVWHDKIIDGHQRLAVVRKLLTKGYRLKNEIPVVEIEAANEQEAAEKLLLAESHYGRLNDAGFLQFIEQYELDVQGFIGEMDLPDIDLDNLLSEHFSDDLAPEAGIDANMPTLDPPETVTLKIICNKDRWTEAGQTVLKQIEDILRPFNNDFTMQLTE
jgi:hypothetical protein